jgi:hypothetical protein
LIDLCIIISLKKVKRCDCEEEEKNGRHNLEHSNEDYRWERK